MSITIGSENISPAITNVVIYHGDCPDGVSAAWMFTQLPEFEGNTTYYGTNIRKLDEDTLMPNLTGKNVYIVDYSYLRYDLLQICYIANHVYILDHHETAEDDLTDIESVINNITCVFDMDRCGAEITWDFLQPLHSGVDRPGLEKPWWMKHIRDQDLWKWEHPDSKSFAYAFRDLGITFSSLDYINDLYGDSLDEFIELGRKIYEIDLRKIYKICGQARRVEFDGYVIYTVESVDFKSEVGNILASRPECDFALVYCPGDNNGNSYNRKWYISLRGVAHKGLNLTKIAKKYGGGGHPLACGFSYTGYINDLFGDV